MIFEFATAVQSRARFIMRFMAADLARRSAWVWFSRR
jgi:hypothetical protein